MADDLLYFRWEADWMFMTNTPRVIERRTEVGPTSWVATRSSSPAMRIVRSASELTPESWQDLLTLVAEQRLEEAHEQITQYLRSFPDHPQLWIQRGNLFWKQHQMEEAELAYRQAATLAPESAPACWCLVLLYQHLERTDEAARWYQRAMANGLPMAASFSLPCESGN